jgi:hypothetical protein
MRLDKPFVNRRKQPLRFQRHPRNFIDFMDRYVANLLNVQVSLQNLLLQRFFQKLRASPLDRDAGLTTTRRRFASGLSLRTDYIVLPRRGRHAPVSMWPRARFPERASSVDALVVISPATV